MNPDHKVQPIIEGRRSKGGQNEPNLSSARPPAPQGSGGNQTALNAKKAQEAAERMMNPDRDDAKTLRALASQMRSIIPAGKGVHSTEVLAIADRIEKMEAALKALYEWYDRDGSVGGADQIFEEHREALT